MGMTDIKGKGRPKSISDNSMILKSGPFLNKNVLFLTFFRAPKEVYEIFGPNALKRQKRYFRAFRKSPTFNFEKPNRDPTLGHSLQFDPLS